MTKNEEINRQQRVADLMVTAYSCLRDCYAKRARMLTLIIFLSSVMLCTATFLPDALSSIGFQIKWFPLLLGILSSVVLFASIAELSLRWRELSQQYRDAADRMAEAKAKLRMANNGEKPIPEGEILKLFDAYNAACEGLPRIPDRQFISLKAYHLRKIELSKMCDAACGCPLWILRLKLLWQGIKAASETTKQLPDKR